MKSTDEILLTAKAYAKNRVSHMKQLTLPEKQAIQSAIQMGYAAGYDAALRDTKLSDIYKDSI